MSQVNSWLITEWVTQLSSAISGMMGEAVRGSESGPASPAVEPGNLCWVQALSLGQDISVAVHSTKSHWYELGAAVLKAAGLEDADEATIRGTYLEILQQGLSGFAQSFGRRIGLEVTCQEGHEEANPPRRTEWNSVEFEVTGQSIPLAVAFSRELIERLDPPAAVAKSPTSVALAAAPAAPENTSKTVGLLMEVDLPVSVSFGRAQMRLKDVIKLTTGSIVELNRNVNEPVEIIVNNCVIARGEVVVVEGNYGVRIQQIVSQQERLRTLF